MKTLEEMVGDLVLMKEFNDKLTEEQRKEMFVTDVTPNQKDPNGTRFTCVVQVSTQYQRHLSDGN